MYSSDVTNGLFRYGLFVLAFVMLVGTTVTGCTSEKPVIRIHDFDTDSSHLSNAIFEFIVENGYGYPVETVIETSAEMQENLASGEIDLNLEGWQQNAFDWYERETQNGNVINLGMIYEGGPQFFVIPKWVAEEHGITTVFDMQDKWELFPDPEEPSKGVFYNCIIGWECSRINRMKLEAYGLTRFYNIKSPGSAVALRLALARPQDRHQPVFAYYWAPSDIMGAYEWHVLAEPAYSPECWANITVAKDSNGAQSLREGCAYENLPVEKLANGKFRQKAPDVSEMAEKMVVGLDAVNETLAWSSQNNVRDWELVAIHYLNEYPERWESWVSPDARANIMQALESVSD